MGRGIKENVPKQRSEGALVRHPCGAGGLVSGAASKAVVPLVEASR